MKNEGAIERILGFIFLSILLTVFLGFGHAEKPLGKIMVTSSAFGEGENIPSDFTCDGADMSPPIGWSGIPSNTQSLAVIVEDPDAPVGHWTHWLVYDLPPTLTQLPAGIPVGEKLFLGGFQGRTDFKTTGYGGPCPPKGTHRYFFKVYALDNLLPLKSGASKEELVKAMQGHVLAAGQLMGRYQRN